MQPVPRIDEDLFRPRHFRPLRAGAPVVADERHAVAIETCRARLVMVAVVFALVFLVVTVRLLAMPLVLGGSGEVYAGRVRPAEPAAAAARRYRRSQRPAAGDDPRRPVALCRHPPYPGCARGDAGNSVGSAPAERSRRSGKTDLGQELCLDQAPPDADPAVSRSTASAFRGCSSSTRSAAFIRTAIWRRTSSGSAGSTTTGWPGSSGRSTRR